MTEYTIYLIGGEENESGTLLAETANGACHLEFRYRGKEVNSRAMDFFEAFVKLRLILEKDHLIPFCYGASLNVYPSGMCRDMANGLAAYKLQLEKEPTMDDLVNIFDKGHDVIPASVKNQKEYFNKWLKTKRI
ncbi:MAG: hypothetical protein HQK56_09735 [Deltaproteobacteria bacterium]|nr:hypothetical protein [Deltaproteobacteria bacterium]